MKIENTKKLISGDISQPYGPVRIFQLGKNLMKCQQIIVRRIKFSYKIQIMSFILSRFLSDALYDLFFKISVPLENVPSWENDLFLWNIYLAGRKGTDLKILFFLFHILKVEQSDQNYK